MKSKLSKICTLTAGSFLKIMLYVLCFVIFAVCSDNFFSGKAPTEQSAEKETVPEISGKIISSNKNPAVAVDGDSLEIGTRRIRLMGIDAPEYTQQCKTPEGRLYPCGKQAAEYLRKLIKKQNIACYIHRKDRYERELCTCYAGKTDLNAEMIHSGNAVVYLESRYKQLEREARQKHIGIWNGTFMRPRLFRLLKQQQKKRSSTN